MIGAGYALFGLTGAGLGALVGAFAATAADGSALGVVIGVWVGVFWFFVAILTERRPRLQQQQGDEKAFVKPTTHVRAVERHGDDQPPA
jgi:hypothetical protein